MPVIAVGALVSSMRYFDVKSVSIRREFGVYMGHHRMGTMPSGAPAFCVRVFFPSNGLIEYSCAHDHNPDKCVNIQCLNFLGVVAP